MSRIWSIAAYAALPGQSVLPTSRWVKIVGSVGVAPNGNLVNEPPAEVRTTVPLGVEVVDAESPAQQPAHGAQLDRRRRHDVEVAEHRHTPGVAVEPAGVRPLDRFVDTARPALEDLAVLVDQRVVGNVAPAQRPGVVGVDGADDSAESCGE